MKKSLLTIAAAAISTVAFGQGYAVINTPSAAGFNTTSSSSAAATGWYTGNVTLAVYAIAASGNFSLAQTIDADAAVAGTEQTAIGLIKSDFTLQNIGTSSPSSASVIFNIQGGDFNTVASGGGQSAGGYYVGSSISGNVFFAIIATTASGLSQGGLVLDAAGAAGNTVGSAPPGTANLIANDWGNGQNMLLATVPVPEPTTLALAGLGGLSLLALRRRKA